jgi:glutamate-1-semialdehyde 2,1-aminomutase
VGGNPIVFDRVKGPYCWDVDGNKYIDYIGSWGPAIVGAANDEVNEALKAQIEKGTSFGAPSALEVGWWLVCVLGLGRGGEGGGVVGL